MARRPKPWFREARDAWFVTINGVQHNLGPSKKAAFDRFYELMWQPVQRPVDAQSVVAVIDLFLEWVQSHRSPNTYEWYRHRLQRFAEKSSRYELPEDEIVRKISTLKRTRCTRGIEVNKSDAELRDEARRKLLNKKAAENAPRYSLYALRHSWATKALKSGLDGLTVAILMGHSGPSNLARVYQHLSHDPQHLLSQARRANAGAK